MCFDQVKCDETPGGCKNCARLSLPCPNAPAPQPNLFPESGAGSSTDLPGAGQVGQKRLRTYRSCRHCRVSKSRCSGERPICLRCRQRNLECTYDGKEAPAWAEAASAELNLGRSVSPGEESGVGGSSRMTSARLPGEVSPASKEDSMSGYHPTSAPSNTLSW